MKNNKIFNVVAIIVILLGIVMMVVKGFNYDLLHSEHTRVEINIGKEFNKDDISKIVKETIKEPSVVRKTNLFGVSVAIDTKNVTDEELNNLFSKLNEKYGKNYTVKDLKRDEILTELGKTDISTMKDEDITSLISEIKEKYNLEYTKEELQSTSMTTIKTTVSATNIWDMLKYMVLPAVISLAIVAVYYAIRFHKMYKKAWLLEPIKLIVDILLIEAFLLAVIAISRIPVAEYVVTILIFVWLLKLVSATVQNENRLKNIVIEKDK